MPDTQPVRIDVVSDVVCPWCFIGKHRLEKALALRPDIPVEVHWRPYFSMTGFRARAYRASNISPPSSARPSATRASPSASLRRPRRKV